MIRVKSVEGATPSKPTNIPLASIRLDGGTQARAKLNDETIAEYSEAIAAGATFPPITVFYDGTDYWLGDGFHRHAAHLAAGKKKIIADVKPGTSRDAILHSVGANETHGLRRTRDDKRKAVMTLLEDSEWSTWPNTRVAAQCGVSESYVRHLRLNEDIETQTTRTVTRGGVTYSMDTAAIGAGKTGGEVPKEITSETIVSQGVEGGDEAEKPVEEITTQEAPANDPLGSAESSGRSFDGPLDHQSASPVEDPFDAPADSALADPVTPVIEANGIEEQPSTGAADGKLLVSDRIEVSTPPEGIANIARSKIHLEMRRFDGFCKDYRPEFVARGVSVDDAASIRMMVGRMNKWLDAFLAAAKAGGKGA